jgi:hypothetical protein
MSPILRNSSILIAGAIALSQAAVAGLPIELRQGEVRRFTLNDGRSILISCSQSGGRQTANEIPLAAGRSTQITLYRDSSPTLVTCSNRISVPRPNPRPVPRPIPAPQPNPYPNPYPNPQPASTEVVLFSNSDSCSGTVSGYAYLRSGEDVRDQCRAQLTSPNSRTWSMKVNGQCRDISDTSAIEACAQVSVPQRDGDTQITMFSNSDSCSGNVSASAIFSEYRPLAEQCQALASRNNGRVWSVLIGNSCQDISDTDVMSACMNLNLPRRLPSGTTEAVIYSNSDSCSGSVSGSVSLIPDLDLQDQCSNLTRIGSSTRAWSVKANGRCSDIADTDVVSACLNVRVPSYRGARQVVVYSNSDSCSGGVSAAGYIDPRYSPMAQCQALKQNGSSSRGWSVRVDDRCIDVQDTDYVSACMNAAL